MTPGSDGTGERTTRQVVSGGDHPWGGVVSAAGGRWSALRTPVGLAVAALAVAGAAIVAIVAAVGAVFGAVLLVPLAYAAFGDPGAVIAILISPVLVPLVPLLYGLLAQWWMPALLAYGPLALLVAVWWVGRVGRHETAADAGVEGRASGLLRRIGRAVSGWRPRERTPEAWEAIRALARGLRSRVAGWIGRGDVAARGRPVDSASRSWPGGREAAARNQSETGGA